MKTFGVTGGIGMGKSTAAQRLHKRGVAVVDTDILARQVVEPGQPALKEIREAFGGKVVGSDGQLNRGELARIVFSDPAARQQLEAITHPRIRKLWLSHLESWRKEQRPVGIVVIPLLFETRAQSELDAVICVACSTATQQQRLSQRGWSPEAIQQRIAAQWPIEKKIAAADYVVWTEAGLDVLDEQLARIIRPGS